MRKRFNQMVLSLALALGVASMATVPAGAINVFDDACTGTNNNTTICKAKKDSVDPLIQAIVGILLFVIGVISVIMIIVGGIRFNLSGGDPSQVKSARETIIYAVVGLVISLLAFAIVKFIVGWF